MSKENARLVHFHIYDTVLQDLRAVGANNGFGYKTGKNPKGSGGLIRVVYISLEKMREMAMIL